MPKIVALILLFIATTASARQDTLKYRIYLTDKAATSYSLDRPEEFLSARAIARRLKQQLPVDSTDLPLCRQYLEAIMREGVTVVAQGKWENFVTLSCNDQRQIDSIARLPFVRTVQRVWRAPASSGTEGVSQRDSLHPTAVRTATLYGVATEQISRCNGHLLHAAGFRGDGMVIAVIDAGFQNLDRISAMQTIRVLGTRDFVDPKVNLYEAHSHGLSVLSCMAMNQPYEMIGTAPEASYWLLRSEDPDSEQPVEEDYWVAAIEFADSVGVDLVNSSLGYVAFDDPSHNYSYRELDGAHALISRQASRMAAKGMLLVCSAGNSGVGSWKKISVPADAKDVLTVGAVDQKGELAPFSSIGNTADNRVKPDVVAVGVDVSVMQSNGEIGFVNGTSFATPILCGLAACLWQARPELSAQELLQLIQRAGDRSAHPDNIYGYGLPDLWNAYQTNL